MIFFLIINYSLHAQEINNSNNDVYEYFKPEYKSINIEDVLGNNDSDTQCFSIQECLENLRIQNKDIINGN